jgi:hypothetical protein
MHADLGRIAAGIPPRLRAQPPRFRVVFPMVRVDQRGHVMYANPRDGIQPPDVNSSTDGSSAETPVPIEARIPPPRSEPRTPRTEDREDQRENVVYADPRDSMQPPALYSSNDVYSVETLDSLAARMLLELRGESRPGGQPQSRRLEGRGMQPSTVNSSTDGSSAATLGPTDRGDESSGSSRAPSGTDQPVENEASSQNASADARQISHEANSTVPIDDDIEKETLWANVLQWISAQPGDHSDDSSSPGPNCGICTGPLRVRCYGRRDDIGETPVVLNCGHFVGMSCYAQYATDRMREGRNPICPYCRRLGPRGFRFITTTPDQCRYRVSYLSGRGEWS